MHQWYILQVYSGNEQKIKKELLAQLEKKGLKKNIEEILIPSEDVIIVPLLPTAINFSFR